MNQMDLVAEAWKDVEKAVMSVRASDIPFPIEQALDNLRDEMILAGILNPENFEEN